jgi:anti-sigma B factor antagonist
MMVRNVVVDEGTTAVFQVDGELDMTTAAEFRRELLAALDTHGPDVTLDLSRVSFMDCAGLGVLAFACREASRVGGRVTLTGLPDMIARMLRLLGFSSYFELDAPGA